MATVGVKGLKGPQLWGRSACRTEKRKKAFKWTRQRRQDLLSASSVIRTSVINKSVAVA